MARILLGVSGGIAAYKALELVRLATKAGHAVRVVQTEASQRFVCIVDPGKQVDVLGRFPLPVEVIPMARSLVARQLVAMTGGQPVWREAVTTDNGNWILDLHGLRITDPKALETAINQIPGVVSVGLFARRPADVVIVGGTAVEVI